MLELKMLEHIKVYCLKILMGYKGFCDLNLWLNELNRLYVILKGDKKQIDEGLYIT
jgi:hypothetical protein